MRRCVRLLEKLVIVESPNKVIKVESLLSDPKVVPDWSFKSSTLANISAGPERALAMATTGHFMSLKEITWTPLMTSAVPSRGDDFPPNGVLASFALEWEILSGRRVQDTVAHYIEEKAANLTEIIIATDPDREGELIAVHALHLIQRMFPSLNVPFTRAYMHSITVDGIRAAMRDRRAEFDHNLANAAEARHAMDRIFGFLGSSVVRYANPNMRSIGRVQTPALILIDERERKIAQYLERRKSTFEVHSVCSFPSGQGGGFTQVVTITPQAKDNTFDWGQENGVKELLARWRVEDARNFALLGSPVVQKTTSDAPLPFTMATLIAKANRQLHMTSESVSACLQDLFQMGHITYPRTDSTRVDDSVLPAIYAAIKKEFGARMLHRAEDRTSASKKKSKKASKTETVVEGNVEDAHEAIRPTNVAVKGSDLGASLPANTRHIYDLIRRNTLAAFMIPMEVERIAAAVGFTAPGGEALQFQLEGRHTVEPGWTIAFRQGGGKGSAAVEAELDAATIEDGGVLIPSVSREEFKAIKELKDTLSRSSSAPLTLRPAQVHENRPSPPLPYSEGNLIEELKNNGVGRPSTYPMIVKTLLTRNYITMNKGRCETTPVGRMLVETSKSTFPSIVDIGFTSSFEKKLDRVAKPTAADVQYLQQYQNISEADYVLSSFVSRFLNYVTEATKNQRVARAAGTNTAPQDTTTGTPASSAVGNSASDTIKAGAGGTGAAAVAQVPDLLDSSRNYRTFTALQNRLNEYLRRYFPPAPASAWAAASKSGGSGKSMYTKRSVRQPKKSRKSKK